MKMQSWVHAPLLIGWKDRRRMIEEVMVIFSYKAKFEANPGYRRPWGKREKWGRL